MKVSKRNIAREWLIFLACLPFGFPVCFWMGYCYGYGYLHASTHELFDWFWNTGWGLYKGRTLIFWFLPYFAVSVIRSIFCAVRALHSPEISN
jgi:hypothetical protein